MLTFSPVTNTDFVILQNNKISNVQVNICIANKMYALLWIALNYCDMTWDSYFVMLCYFSYSLFWFNVTQCDKIHTAFCHSKNNNRMFNFGLILWCLTTVVRDQQCTTFVFTICMLSFVLLFALIQWLSFFRIDQWPIKKRKKFKCKLFNIGRVRHVHCIYWNQIQLLWMSSTKTEMDWHVFVIGKSWFID